MSINLHSADERISFNNSKSSEESVGIERQIAELRKSLASITARPISSIAQDLVGATDFRVRKALELELRESKRAVTIQEQLMSLVQTSTSSKTSVVNPAVLLIASITGFSEKNTQVSIEIYFSLLLELLGAHIWYLYNLKDEIAPSKIINSDVDASVTQDDNDLSRVRAAIDAGELRCTVKIVRKYLSCSQDRAQEICRILKNM